MNIGILHLTDLHIKASDNYILSRVDKIHSALKVDLLNLERIYLIVTGDIVNRGIRAGYPIAKEFLDKLKNKFETTNKALIVKLIIIPGNHDCNFTYNNQLRDNTIKTLGYNSIGDDDSVVDLCLKVQADFWEFYNRFNDCPPNKLFYQIYDQWDDNSICFNCLNTSWMSKQNEELNLFFPVKRYDNHENLRKGKINISLMHHPIFWFTPNGLQNNRRELQGFLEDISSVILYGHEHEKEHKKSVELWSNMETLYFSGKAFQNGLNNDSGFQLLLINSKNNNGQVKQFCWDEDIYLSSEPKDIELNRQQFGNKRFKHRIDFFNDLNSMKIPISIENNSELKLSDFYVFPDLERTEKNNNDIDSFYDSENLISEASFTTCIIEGENQSGKTSLLSILYREFVVEEKYPLLVDCKSFKTTQINKVLKAAFFNQYKGKEVDFERYLQYDKTRKVILLDNLQSMSFNSKTIKQIIESLEALFGKVIILSNALYGFLSKIEAEFDELVVFSLKPLGYKKRNKLIENYHRLSIPVTTITEELLFERTKHSFNHVQAVLGDKLIPSYPVFVLSILQTIIYRNASNFEQTSYGYCYQSLIHIALANKAKVESEYIDTFFNFLSEFALHLYQTDQGLFSEEDLEEFFIEYKNDYIAAFSFERLKSALLDSLLIVIEDDEWRFSYKYIYYFLVARKLAEIIGKDEGKEAVQYLCANLDKEKNANILIFIAHHSKDDFLIEEATFTAMVPFESIAPITLERNGHFYEMIEDIVKEISSDIIECSSNPVEYRNKMLESQDKNELDRQKHESSNIEENESFSDLMSPFFQAFRALDIVGQIIKNRKGSIKNTQLIEMIVELYNTAFRTISFFGKTLLETKEDFIESLADKVEDGDTKQKIEERVNSFFQYMSLQICLGVFGKVIHSVGQKDLKDLFIEAANKIDTPAADIVTFSINSYYGNLSKGDLKLIAKKYEKNLVVMQIIKARVKAYLYMNYTDYRKRQSFASTLNMKIGAQRR